MKSTTSFNCARGLFLAGAESAVNERGDNIRCGYC